MAWDTQARTDYDASDGVRTSRVTHLRHRDELLQGMPQHIHFAENNTSSTVYFQMGSAQLYIPSALNDTDSRVQCYGVIEAKVDVAGGDVRLRNQTRAVAGLSASVDNTSYEDKVLSIPINDTDRGTIILIELQAKVDTTETITVKNENSLTFYFAV